MAFRGKQPNSAGSLEAGFARYQFALDLMQWLCRFETIQENVHSERAEYFALVFPFSGIRVAQQPFRCQTNRLPSFKDIPDDFGCQKRKLDKLLHPARGYTFDLSYLAPAMRELTELPASQPQPCHPTQIAVR